MTILWLIIALLVAVSVHESAHALALRKLGIPIDKAGLGLPFPPVLTIRTRRLPFAFTLTPWLLGAYVSVDRDQQKRIDALPYRDWAWFNNAGIVANLITAGVVLAGVSALSGRFAVASVAAAVAVVLWFARKAVAAYVLPALAVPILALVVWSLIGSWKAGDPGVGLVSMAHGMPAHGDLLDMVAMVGIINLSVAALNTAPLFGLDNGKVVGRVLERFAGEVAVTIYEWFGIAVVAVFLLGAFGSDLWAGVTALL